MGNSEREAESTRRRAEFDQLGAAFTARDPDSAMRVIDGIRSRDPELAEKIVTELAAKAQAKARSN